MLIIAIIDETWVITAFFLKFIDILFVFNHFQDYTNNVLKTPTKFRDESNNAKYLSMHVVQVTLSI